MQDLLEHVHVSAFGRTLKGMYDYNAAWTWALVMRSEERARRFGCLRSGGALEPRQATIGSHQATGIVTATLD